MQRSLLALGLLSVLILSACSKPAPVEDSLPMDGVAVPAWQTLMENDCNPMASNSHVWSPIESRVLRGVPLALYGYDFHDDPELKAFFEEDGAGYYTAKTDSATLPEEWQSCTEVLEAHEKTLFDAFKGLDHGTVKRFTNPQVFETMWFWGSTATTSPYDGENSLQITEDYTRYEHILPCEEGYECGAYFIECFGDEACVAGAAG